MSGGMVYLVGAGPGDPDLITRRGLQCLHRADVLVYDRLAAPSLVLEPPRDCQRIYAGKHPGDHSRTMSQAEICALLVEHAHAGRVVCRLKGGDPFVFGRGGEEAAALAAAGIPYEVVPGVTAGVAAPAYAGIPITHRGVATAACFITGHEEPGKDGEVDWRQLGPGDATLVVYMGVSRLPELTGALLQGGRPPETPAAVIRWGTRPEQQTVVGTLSGIATLAAGLKPPALLVVGDVVALREEIGWAETRPLHGRRILLVRGGPDEPSLAPAVRELGAEPWAYPHRWEQQPPATYEQELVAALLAGHGFDYVLFDTPEAVALWQRWGLTLPAGVAIAALGSATAAACAAADLQPMIAAAEPTDLLDRLGAHAAVRAAAAAGR